MGLATNGTVLRRFFSAAAFSVLATSGLHAQNVDPASGPASAPAPTKVASTEAEASAAPPTERKRPRVLFLEDYRRAQAILAAERAAAAATATDPAASEPGPSDLGTPVGLDLSLDEPPTEHLSRNVFLIPDDPRGGILSDDEIDHSLAQWDRVLVGFTVESFPTFRDMELGYRHPGWPTAVTRERMTHVVDDPDEENPALPDSVISWGYRLAPYLIDSNDRWQTATPLSWELVEGPQGRLLRTGDHLAEVERSMAGSLAAVGHTEDAESLALRAFLARARAHSVDDSLAQRSVRQLIWIYHDWDRAEEKFYRALLRME